MQLFKERRIEYVLENKIVELSDKEKDNELLENILKAQNQLNEANINFEYAEQELIEYYSYEIKACSAKLNYLIKRAKIKKLEMDIAKKIKVQFKESEEAV